jgi:hypothetical protein
VPDENAARHIEDAVIGVELLDCCTTAGGVAFTENRQSRWRLFVSRLFRKRYISIKPLLSVSRQYCPMRPDRKTRDEA